MTLAVYQSYQGFKVKHYVHLFVFFSLSILTAMDIEEREDDFAPFCPKERLFRKITFNNIGSRDVTKLLEYERKCPSPSYYAVEQPYEVKYLTPSERFDIEYGVPTKESQILLKKVFLLYWKKRSSFSNSVLSKSYLEKQEQTDAVKIHSHVCSEVIVGFLRKKIKIIKSLNEELKEDNKKESLYRIKEPISSDHILVNHLLNYAGIRVFNDGVNISFGNPGAYTDKIIFCKPVMQKETKPIFVIRIMNKHGNEDINPLLSLRYNKKFRNLCDMHFLFPTQIPRLVQLARVPVGNNIKCRGIFQFTDLEGNAKYGSISHYANGEELSRVLYKDDDPQKILTLFGKNIRNVHDKGGVHGDLSRRNAVFNRKTGVVTLIDLAEMHETLKLSISDCRFNDLFRYYFYEFAKFASESYKKSDAEILTKQNCQQFMCLLDGYVKNKKEKELIFKQFSKCLEDLEDVSKLIKIPVIEKLAVKKPEKLSKDDDNEVTLQTKKFLNDTFWNTPIMKSVRGEILEWRPYNQNRIDIAKSIFLSWLEKV